MDSTVLRSRRLMRPIYRRAHVLHSLSHMRTSCTNTFTCEVLGSRPSNKDCSQIRPRMSAAGCIFTDWAGVLAPLAVKHESVAHVRNSAFLNMQLQVELVDVSYGGIVQFFRNSLRNVTLGHRAVVSTTTNDYDFFLEPYAGAQVEYYADDEDEAKETQASIVVVVVQVEAPFWSEYMITDGLQSDCMYQRTGVNVTMPGCNPGSVQQRARMRQRSSEPPAGPQAGFPYLDPEALMRQRLHDSNSTWLSSMRQVLRPASELLVCVQQASAVALLPIRDLPSVPSFPSSIDCFHAELHSYSILVV
eukprot:jgi/Ulvmu1/3530/UM163_0012.1